MAYELTREIKKLREGLITRIINNDLHGKCIYLLGSAEFGPTNEPMLVKSTVGLHNKFGTRGTLIDAWHAIKYVSKNNKVFCVKTTGEHSKIYLNVNIANGDVVKNGLTFCSSHSNEIFNDIELTIDVDSLTFKFPKVLNIDPKVYKYKDYPTIGYLVEKINKDTKMGNGFIYGYYDVDYALPTQGSLFPVNPTVCYMYGGYCGLNYSKNMLYNCLNRTYEILESCDIDIVIPLDAFLDDVYPDIEGHEGEQYYGEAYYHTDKDYLTEDVYGHKLSYMDQLINFCIVQMNFGMVTTGVLGFNSNYKYWSRYLSESDDLVDMLTYCFKYNLSLCRNSWYSFLVSVVAGDIMYNHGTIIDNGYLAYAAMIADTKKIDSITNKPISKSVRIWHEFSQDVLQKLADSGIVTFRHSPLYDVPVVYDAITAMPESENFRLECNVRMIQMCISYMNELFQIYIGHNIYKLIKEKIIEHDLSTLLTILVNSDIINWYEFQLVPQYHKGHLKVYLSLKTNYMVKAIHVCSLIDIEYLED